MMLLHVSRAGLHSRISQIWLPVDSDFTHAMFEPLLVQDRFISILVTKSI